ncbi:MAG TPA: DUF4058 family protein [Gemmataceae bacterium]|nr:DUF4058 family protein [Gemmataceae bacterium]
MPLLDHVHAPFSLEHHWESFHSNWATRIADALSDCLPPEFIAEEHAHAGPNLEIDVATYERTSGRPDALPNGPQVATAAPPTWAPPAPAKMMPAVFPDTFEVRVLSTVGGLKVVGAIELISPSNKDRPEERRAFATKCASYLHQGISLIIIDIVTNRRANLHNEIMRLMDAAPDLNLPPETDLYSVAYRPVLRQGQPKIDLWFATFNVGGALPVMPLRLTGDLFVPVDFEATYQEACRRRRLV